jgi:hypothetical protein
MDKVFYFRFNLLMLTTMLIFFSSVESVAQASLPLSRTAWASEPTGWTNSGCSQRTSTSACSGSDATIFDSNGDSRLVFFSAAASQLVFKLKKQSMSGESKITVEESADGSAWASLGAFGTATGATSITDCGDITLSLLSTSRYVRWTYTKISGNCDMDDVSISAANPTIIVSSTILSGFSYVSGFGPSAQQSFTCSGSNLGANITLTAPADYEISLTSGSGFSNSLVLTQSSGSVAATSIYVRLIAGLAVNSYNGEQISASSTGAATKTVTCNGDVGVAGVFINEIMVNPAGSNDGSNMPNTSEWIEFYNSSSAAVDLSCWSFTDGDFSVTFPSGASIAAGGFYTVASAAGSGLSPDLDWALCGCTTGGLTSEVGVFTNGGEQVILYNSAGSIVDAVIWGTGQGLPGSITTATTGSCTPKTLTLPAAGSTYESIGTVSDGISNERDYDASSTWQQTSSPTFASTNGINPLPIELMSFNAACEPNGSIRLSWCTATETNNDYFTLEKGTDITTFEPVAIIDGAGNSSSLLNYSSLDLSPVAGLNYYRLKQTDFDGETSYSGVISIDFSTLLKSLNIYPNPASDFIHVNIKGEMEDRVTYEINTLRGLRVFNDTVYPDANGISVNVQNLSSGVYILKIFRGTEVKQTLFIKQ